MPARMLGKFPALLLVAGQTLLPGVTGKLKRGQRHVRRSMASGAAFQGKMGRVGMALGAGGNENLPLGRVAALVAVKAGNTALVTPPLHADGVGLVGMAFRAIGGEQSLSGLRPEGSAEKQDEQKAKPPRPQCGTRLLQIAFHLHVFPLSRTKSAQKKINSP